MRSSSYADEVLRELGERVPYGIAQAVAATKADLAEYRQDHPRWVAEASARGLANWIHDRLWVHLLEQLDGYNDIVFVDKGPTRQFRVGTRYLFRAKRHHQDERISTYLTPSALAFWRQGRSTLFPDMDDVRLAVGYHWDADLNEIQDAVISLRDGMDKVVWAVSVGFAPVTGAVELRPLTDQPELPIVELGVEDEAGEDETGTEA